MCTWFGDFLVRHFHIGSIFTQCLTSVLAKAKVASGLGKLIDALRSKNSFVRRKAVDGITNVVKNMTLYNVCFLLFCLFLFIKTSSQLGTSQEATFEKFFSQLNFADLLTDGSNEVRIAARKLYWASDAVGIKVEYVFLFRSLLASPFIFFGCSVVQALFVSKSYTNCWKMLIRFLLPQHKLSSSCFTKFAQCGTKSISAYRFAQKQNCSSRKSVNCIGEKSDET